MLVICFSYNWLHSTSCHGEDRSSQRIWLVCRKGRERRESTNWWTCTVSLSLGVNNNWGSFGTKWPIKTQLWGKYLVKVRTPELAINTFKMIMVAGSRGWTSGVITNNSSHWKKWLREKVISLTGIWGYILNTDTKKSIW